MKLSKEDLEDKQFYVAFNYAVNYLVEQSFRNIHEYKKTEIIKNE